MDDRYSLDAQMELEREIHWQSLEVLVDRCLSHAPCMWNEIWEDVRREAHESVRKMKKLFEEKRKESHRTGGG